MQNCTYCYLFSHTGFCSYMCKETVNNLFHRNKWECQEKSRSALKNNQIEFTFYTNPRCVNRLGSYIRNISTVNSTWCCRTYLLQSCYKTTWWKYYIKLSNSLWTFPSWLLLISEIFFSELSHLGKCMQYTHVIWYSCYGFLNLFHDTHQFK